MMTGDEVDLKPVSVLLMMTGDEFVLMVVGFVMMTEDEVEIQLVSVKLPGDDACLCMDQ